MLPTFNIIATLVSLYCPPNPKILILVTLILVYYYYTNSDRPIQEINRHESYVHIHVVSMVNANDLTLVHFHRDLSAVKHSQQTRGTGATEGPRNPA